MMASMAPIQDAMRALGGGAGAFLGAGGGGRRGFSPMVRSGDYKIVLKLGSDVQTQMLRIERIGDITGALPTFGTDDMNGDEEDHDEPTGSKNP